MLIIYIRVVIKLKKLVFMIIVLFLAAALPVAARAQEHYKFGMIMGRSSRDQGLKPIFVDLFKYVAQDLGVDIELSWFNDNDKFLKAVESKELDIAYAKEFDIFFEMVRTYKYKPLMTATAFGATESKVCLYSKSDKNYTSLEGMKGLTLLAYYTKDGYYPLRQLLGGNKPEEFFSKMLPSLSGADSLNRLLAGEADLAFVYDNNIDLLKIGNPSIVKQLKELVCSPPFSNAGIVVNPESKIPQKTIDNIVKIIGEAHKSEALKNYRDMMKRMKIKFLPITMKDYDSMFKLYDEAAKKGWDKDLQKWIDSLPKAK